MIRALQQIREQKKKQSGFTIIEVMIVLAIAAIIMVLVLTAVPALQRSSRNTARRTDATHLANLINEYIANNGGSSPTAVAAGSGTTAGTLYLGSESFTQLKTTPPTPITAVPATVPAASLTQAVIYSNGKCNGNTPVGPGNSANSMVVYYGVESASGTTPQCIASNG